MDEKRYGDHKCFTTKAGGSLMARFLSAVLSTILIGVMISNPALGQNPCDEIG